MTTRYTDSEIIAMWLESQPSPHTRDCYRRDAGRLQRLGKPLKGVVLSDLQKFSQALADEGLAPISCARSIAAVKSLFGFCFRMRFIKSNPALELRLPKYELRLAERVLSEGGLKCLLAVECTPRDRILLNLLYFAGLRVSETCNLKWRNLHLQSDKNLVTVFGKNGRTRAVAIPDGLARDLVALRAAGYCPGADQPVFASRTGRPLDRGRVRAILRDIARRAGIAEPISPHWLRHAHASHALDRGAPIHLVQATLGHASVSTTGRYLHARPTESSSFYLPD